MVVTSSHLCVGEPTVNSTPPRQLRIFHFAASQSGDGAEVNLLSLSLLPEQYTTHSCEPACQLRGVTNPSLDNFTVVAFPRREEGRMRGNAVKDSGSTGSSRRAEEEPRPARSQAGAWEREFHGATYGTGTLLRIVLITSSLVFSSASASYVRMTRCRNTSYATSLTSCGVTYPLPLKKAMARAAMPK